MDRSPHPPQDPEVRGKIDKIASFVAKGGPQAEERLRSDHAGKPQFSFLNFGGEHAEYYRFALQCEIYNMNNGIPPGARPGNDQATQPQPEQQPSFDFAAAQSRIDQLNQEIVSSQANLKAHFDAIPMLRDAEFATAIADAETSKTTSYLERVGLNVGGLDDLLEQLHSKCSKDVVSSMKKWIFEYCTTDQLREVILMYLLARVRATSSSESFRLHVLYLIHDWAHYCNKKKQTGIIQVLARYVPQLYAFAADNVKDPQITQKLDKLIGTWEGSKFFDDTVFKSLRNTAVIIQNYKTQTQAEHQKLCNEINQRLLKTFAGYEKQHNEFATHMTNQITAIEAQIEMERMKAEQAHRKNLPSLMGGARRSRFDCGPAAGDYGGFFNAPSAAAAPPSVWNEGAEDEDVDGAPIDSSSAPLPSDFDENSLIPRAPFYELPAGVMMGQIKIEDLTYKPIEVSKLRMPPALPPTPRLLMAIDAFYGPPNPDRPRDTQGWEKDGLAEFYDRKSRLRKVLEDTHCINGKTFEDLISNRVSAAELEEEREEREEERKKKIDRYLRGSRSRSRDGSRSRSRSPSASPRRRKTSSSSSRRSSSRSLSPDRPQFNRRSPSPPPARFAIPTGPPAPLGADNKGAQLMAKMGWSGKGLGAKEHGMQDPVSGGEVRAGEEKFKGLGFKEEKDEFTDFRKRTASQYSERWLNRLV